MKNIIYIPILLLLLPLVVTAQSQPPAPRGDDHFQNLIEDAEKNEGFLTLYDKGDRLYLVISEDDLDQDFILNFQLARGIGSSGLYGGTMLNVFESNIVALQRQDNRIFLVNKPHRYIAEDGTPQGRAIDLTYGTSVLDTGRIEAISDDSLMIVNVYDWFVGDLSNISQRVQSAVSQRPGQPGRASFDRSRSHLELVQSFPQNTNVQAKLTFRNLESGGPRTLADSRFVPVSIFYSMAMLPDEPMKPRDADDRLGYFMTVHKDFTDSDNEFFKRYINRWRLECDGPPAADGLCDPKKPIVYYLENTIPERYRRPMMEGIEAWSVAFEEAGFRDAVQAEMLPDTVEAGDIRYPTLRWNVSDQPGYGAIGPSVVDPRTGEILDADQLYEANMFLGFSNTFRDFVDPQQAINEIYMDDEYELEAMKQGIKTASFYTEMGTQVNLMRAAMLHRGELRAGDPMPDDYVDQATRWVTMHEVGHTLGLRHNFRSSTDTPMDRLHDREWTGERGVYSSVMDYPSPNIGSNEDQNGHYYNTG